MIHVLIIENDPMVAKFNAIFIERFSSYKLIGTAPSVTEGWDYLKSKHIDLILLDVYLQQENGLDFLKELRRINHPVDVMFLASVNDCQTIQTAFRYGAVDYVIKPFEFDRLQQALDRFEQTHKRMKNHSFQQDEVDQLFLTNDRYSH
ncbi:response regulator [Bacillus sp. FJAT-45037]|uniref:response regulator n=1 Tax=Bacillus sp. FJAT-45037 TaxID=2011007 RepID=UPI000C23F3EA|nr:response regulator [Bacillus sp. FJAT-45037]